MKKNKKIDLLTRFQIFLYEKGKINDHDWTFEKQAKKFVKRLARQRRLEQMIENALGAPYIFPTPEAEGQEIKDERGSGRRFRPQLPTDIVHTYIKESELNKGDFVLVIQCRNGKKFVVAGQHHTPTYLMPYDQSSDIKK